MSNESKLQRPFKPMLGGEADVEALEYPVLGSPKLDGVRAIVRRAPPLKAGGADRFVVFARSLKPIPNEFVQHLFGREEFEGFDGELTVGSPNAPNVMQATTSGVMSRQGTPDVQYHVFDIWNRPEMPFSERIRWIFQYLKTLDDIVHRDDLHVEEIAQQKIGLLRACLSRVMFLKQIPIGDRHELDNFEKSALDAGYEGVMLRRFDGDYKHGRSTTKEGLLLKLKRFKDAEAEILDVLPAMHNTGEAVRNALGVLERSKRAENLVEMDMVGKIRVRNGAGQVFDCAPGTMDHNTRRALWSIFKENPAALVGKIITYKFFPHGEKDLPRHPSFKVFRSPIDFA